MSERELFERILGSLHEAALDDAHWPATAGLIDEACGSKGNSIVCGDGASQDDIEIFFVRFCYRGQRREDLERLYFETYHAVDERLPPIRQLPDSQLAHVSSLYTDQEKKTSPVYNKGLALADNVDCLNVRLDGPDGSRIVWVVGDPVDGDGWSSGQVETIERLLPHLRQFERVRQALVDAQSLATSAAALLENRRCGVIHLDRRGRIAAANDCARDILRKGDGLADRGGQLCASSPADDAALLKLLARALPPYGVQGASGSITVKRSVVSPRLVLHAIPVSGEQTDVRPSRVAALVLVVDPASRGRIDPALVAALLGLTSAESQVAVMLAQGFTIRNIAGATGRSEGTIRWHTKHIFSKLGISRQVELVQLVLSLSDIPPAQN
ncbi:MAG: helix-turn-helix transcriptional regulator [Rhodospirillaceae bacterium]|nr:helix-turn-helix transcriptional regulator [Rhodospirillaceae bacterium]